MSSFDVRVFAIRRTHVASPASEPPDGQLNAVSADGPTDA